MSLFQDDDPVPGASLFNGQGREREKSISAVHFYFFGDFIGRRHIAFPSNNISHFTPGLVNRVNHSQVWEYSH
jgi:hypothetical protein